MSFSSSIAPGTVINLGTTGPVRVDKTLSTGSVANAATATGSVTIDYFTAELVKVTSTVGGYLVLYTTAAARSNDSRTLPAATDPDAGKGILCDLVFDPSTTTSIEIAPSVLLHNEDTVPAKDIYWKFYRSEPGTGSASITLTIVGLQST